MRLTKLLEDLDDKDTFEHDCNYCQYQSRQQVPDLDEFHEAHTAAREAAKKAGPYDTKQYTNEYAAVMSKYGYRYKQALLDLATRAAAARGVSLGPEHYYWVKA